MDDYWDILNNAAMGEIRIQAGKTEEEIVCVKKPNISGHVNSLFKQLSQDKNGKGNVSQADCELPARIVAHI